jgi:FKBP-type peptidyl-prolyl cis-trans isomerase FkpA
MKASSRTLPRLAALAMLPMMVAVPLAASGAPVRQIKASPKTSPAGAKSVVANDSIIPLPLTPIVPAAQRLCAARTPSGLGYTILRQGQGAKPAAEDTVLVNYVGYLAATGAVFDQGMHSPLPANQVIPGFSQGLQMTGRNGVVRLCIPAALGYGAQESGPIPANSDLVFQVEVIDFKTAAEIEAMRKAQPSEAAPEQDTIGKPQN